MGCLPFRAVLLNPASYKNILNTSLWNTSLTPEKIYLKFYRSILELWAFSMSSLREFWQSSQYWLTDQHLGTTSKTSEMQSRKISLSTKRDKREEFTSVIRNLLMWQICSLSRLWSWFHGCTHISKFINLICASYCMSFIVQ